MAINSRQNNLFAAEDWEVAYQAYSQVDFQAYDFDTIRTAMVEYIRTNFPENFNDYIESSEFIAIIELLAYLAQSIAFRMDVNTRENFLETAERRDSVFKLARQLGYNPKRNIAASGLAKIVSVATSEPLTDSSGTPLNNRTVSWNDANNPDSYEQFITILNSAFGNVNRFSKPVKSGTVGGIATDKYDVKTPANAPLTFNFKRDINGISRAFDFVNVEFDDAGFFYEKHPDPKNDFSIVHRNDGLGLSSNNTGFFMMFKQGTLANQEFNFAQPVENRQQTVGVDNINETDVYLQQIDADRSVLAKWEKVPNTIGQTLMYNVKAKQTPLLYAVQNLGTGGINLQFADGNFANVPVGNYRLYYRTSDNERFSVQPDDFGIVTTSIPYVNGDGKNYELTITTRLENAVNNSLPAESIAGIKERAPQSYYSQDRMISAQDYQVLPLAKSTNISKLKVTNKTHAGHSRYIDITDPTSTFQTTTSIAEDGALYSEISNSSDYFNFDNVNTPLDFVNTKIPTILKNQKLNDFIYSDFRDSFLNTASFKDTFNLELFNIAWNTLPKKDTGSKGFLTETYTTNNAIDLNTANNLFKIIQAGSVMKFYDPANVGDYKWAKIVSITNNAIRTASGTNVDGPITLDREIPNGWKSDQIITVLRKTLFALERTELQTALASKRTFGLRFDPADNRYYIIENNNLSDQDNFDIANAGDETGGQADASWILKFTYVPVDATAYRYNIEIRGTQFIFESLEEVRFYNVNTNRIQDSATGLALYDTVELTTLNVRPSFSEVFEWRDTNDNNIGDKWYLVSTGDTFNNIPLISRNIEYSDLEVSITSNFGLWKEGSSSSGEFVDEITLQLGTSPNTTDDANVVVVKNSGLIDSLPIVNVAFTNATFGVNILDNNGNIAYSYNKEGTSFNNNRTLGPGAAGDGFGLYLLDSNVTTQSGNLQIRLDERQHYGVDSTARQNRSDTIEVRYVTDTTRLEDPIIYSAIGNFTYPDGFTDPKKIKVTPVNTEGGDAPNNPIQFADFVGRDDIVIFEEYEEFDGYTYTRPVKSGILDLRKEDGVNFSSDYSRIAGNSIGDAENNTGTVHSTDDYEYYLIKSKSVIEGSGNPNTSFDNTIGKLHNKKVYAKEDGKVYQMSKSSTNLQRVSHYESSSHFAKKGRSFTQNAKAKRQQPVVFKWNHIADNSVRIDPSISNIHEMFILTTTYYNEMQSYLNVPGTDYPTPPTPSELETEFMHLNDLKSASDQIVFRSGKFKLLFGDDAEPELQARFKVVRLPGTSLSDNEIRTQVIAAVNRYFNIENWDFGDTFYFTELSSYIHQQVGNAIGSIVIVPKTASGVFGDLFQVKSDADELFISTANILDIDVVDKLTQSNIRPDKSSTGLLTTYDGATNQVGPYAINGYYPLYATKEASDFAGDGTSHTHEFFGKVFYMPNGIMHYHGTYVLDQSVSTNATGNTITLNNTLSTNSADNTGGGSSGNGY